MKKFILLLSFIFISLFSISSVEAQEIEFELDETETEEKSSTPFFDFLEKNFSGSVGLVRAQGEYGHRNFYLWKLKYNQELTDWFKIFVTGSGYHNEFVLDSRLKPECENHQKNLIAGHTASSILSDCKDVDEHTPLTRQFKIKDFETELREAYFDLDIGSFALLSVGKKLNAWGQFELFSPIDIFTLPKKYTTAGLTFSKLDEQIPQNTAQLNLYRNNLVELQLYYFPSLTIDPFFDKIPSELRNYDVPIKDENNKIDYEKRDYPPLVGVDDSVQAARLLFYPNWGIVGLTYYKGFKDYPTILDRLRDVSIDGTTYRYIEEREEYIENNVLGIEAAIPAGRWTLKLEHARILNEKSFSLLNTDDFGGEIYNTDGNNSYYNDFEEELNNLANWIENENNGEANYDYQIAFTALGADADLDRWKFNLVLWVFQFLYDSKAQEARRLEAELEEARGGTPEDFPNTFIFPTFNVVRYWNDNKTALGGFALGFLPQGVGASYYTTFEFWESLTVVAAVEAVEYRGDFAIFDQSFSIQFAKLLSSSSKSL